MPAQPPRQGEEIQPPVLRLTPSADQRRRITTPRRPLPDEGGEEGDGAVGGEAWRTPASIDAQREFYSALLDEVDNYTRAAENTQRSLRSLGSAQQQERIKAEIWKRAQELQEQLEWADKNLGIGFSFVTVPGVGLVSVVGGFEVVVVAVVFENWYEVFEAETLLIIFVVVKISVSNHVVENAGLRRM